MKSNKTSRKHLAVILATVLIVIAVASGSFYYLNSNMDYQGKTESLTLGFFNSEVYTLIYVANDQQYFVDNGLNVTIKHYNTGLAAVNGMLNGEVDITGASEYVLAEKALENESLCMFGSYSKSDKFYLVARTDKGITNLSDLKGKTIGAPLGTNGEYYLGRFLELNKINQTDVSIVNMVPFVQTPHALANGTVDAAVVFQPYIDEIESLVGNQTVMWPIQAGQLAYVDAICTQNWAATHPELITRFLKALIQAEDFTFHHQDEAKATVAKTLNYTDTYLTTIWSDYQFSISLEQSQILAMENEARWLIRNNLTNATSVPDFLKYIYVEGLESIKPESVNIIG